MTDAAAGPDAGVRPVIRVAAAIIERADGHLLFVRKRGTAILMQPGGKLELAESPAETLVRELHEELGLVVPLDSLSPVGRFDTLAANEPGHDLEAHVFDAPLTGVPAVAAEIEELAWIDPGALPATPIAPLSRDILVPLVLARRARR